MVAKGAGKFGLAEANSLYTGRINRVLPHGTKHYMQHLVINHNRKHYEKIYICTYVRLNHCVEQEKLMQHCKPTIKKRMTVLSKWPRVTTIKWRPGRLAFHRNHRPKHKQDQKASRTTQRKVSLQSQDRQRLWVRCKKTYDKPIQHIKGRDITLPTQVCIAKAMVFQWSCMDIRVGP